MQNTCSTPHTVTGGMRKKSALKYVIQPRSRLRGLSITIIDDPFRYSLRIRPRRCLKLTGFILCSSRDTAIIPLMIPRFLALSGLMLFLGGCAKPDNPAEIRAAAKKAVDAPIAIWKSSPRGQRVIE